MFFIRSYIRKTDDNITIFIKMDDSRERGNFFAFSLTF